ncbi:hypothetical protein EXIGLDRAFT_783225 [Exidia glandulosa HHB12029]|uniref:Aspergillopepsin n=2 Tax=Exidia glandulosa HHB12029 TaxID=1314781 RepID=A0A166N6S2_EXIGL|nr:hypothetical protein EXIGLDRAFT_783225 [Exidia glandulosa HHB12029]
MFFVAAFTFGLLATGAFAIPSSAERLQKRIERRASNSNRAHRSSQPAQRQSSLTASVATSNSLLSNAEHATVYTTNWAGGALIGSPAGTFKSVTGRFVVPKVSMPANGNASETYYASAWVGIDGYACDTAILQTGVDFEVIGTTVNHYVWYEWWPELSSDFEGITVKAGDTIDLLVTASSTTTGAVVVKNLKNGNTVFQNLTSSDALCESDAEWIVEDFLISKVRVPMADFKTITFTNPIATQSNGARVGPGNATIIEMRQNGTVFTSTTVSSTSVSVKYLTS